VQTLAQIKALLEERGLRPRHALGQNFLIDKNLLGKLVDAAGVKPGETVLEVGPGTGTLTESLLERGCNVVACELDDELAAMLNERIPALGYGGGERFRLVQGDCLDKGKTLNKTAATTIGDVPFKLVANLPYGAATPLMLNLLIDHPRCSMQAVTIQREVAQRLAAKPGSKDYGLLSVVAQALGTIEIVASLPPECFWPRPDVTSAMVLVRRRPDPLTRDGAGLALLCQRVFSKRRKQLGAILGRDHPLPADVSATQRPEELSPQQFVQLLELTESEPA
jgi:16S rRNA (adenine1518-N6/adenine1519-N6)-dimethyltransferase